MGGKARKLEARSWNSLHRFVFTAALTITSRVVQVRDHLLGLVPRSQPECSTLLASRHTIPSGQNLLDAIFVEPAAEPPQAALLLCHGIGEIAPQWFAVQRLLAENGVASLVFDYSGYGRSTGLIDWLQCEQDAASSFAFVQRFRPAIPISLLGYSLGTGIASAILDRACPSRLILCAGYSSFRKAARAAWIPPFLSPLVPPIWSAEEALCKCSLPILIVHGDRDRLFPMQMAHDLAACSGDRAELLVLPARSHNSPVYYPHPEYWNPIARWILQNQTDHVPSH